MWKDMSVLKNDKKFYQVKLFGEIEKKIDWDHIELTVMAVRCQQDLPFSSQTYLFWIGPSLFWLRPSMFRVRPSHFSSQSFPLSQVSPSHFSSQALPFFSCPSFPLLQVSPPHFSSQTFLFFRFSPSHFSNQSFSLFWVSPSHFSSQTFAFFELILPILFSKLLFNCFESILQLMGLSLTWCLTWDVNRNYYFPVKKLV